MFGKYLHEILEYNSYVYFQNIAMRTCQRNIPEVPNLRIHGVRTLSVYTTYNFCKPILNYCPPNSFSAQENKNGSQRLNKAVPKQ